MPTEVGKATTGLRTGPASPPTDRVVAVLDTLAAAEQGMSASELSRTLDQSHSTIAAILARLEVVGYVERAHDKTYRLGAGLLRVLSGLMHRFPLLGAAQEELARLADALAAGCALTRIGPEYLEVLLTIGPTSGLAVPGQRLPLDPPYGDFAMAWRPPDEVREWLSRSAAPLTSEQVADRHEMLAGIRARGYAVYSIEAETETLTSLMRNLLAHASNDATLHSLRGELTRIAASIARHPYSSYELAAEERPLSVSYLMAPVFGSDGQPHYVVSLHVLRQGMSTADVKRFADAVLAAAQALTSVIGGRSPQ